MSQNLMKSSAIWSKSTQVNEYNSYTIELIKNMIEDFRWEFIQEFNNAILDPKNELHMGYRFCNDDQILWALQSNITEDKFLENPKHYIFRVLLGACGADYWYSFEKDWG